MHEIDKKSTPVNIYIDLSKAFDMGDLGDYFCIFILSNIFSLLVIIQIFSPINNIDRILEGKGNVYNHLRKQLNEI